MASQSRPPARLLAHQDAFAILCGARPQPKRKIRNRGEWRAGQNKTANTYVIEIAI